MVRSSILLTVHSALLPRITVGLATTYCYQDENYKLCSTVKRRSDGKINIDFAARAGRKSAIIQSVAMTPDVVDVWSIEDVSRKFEDEFGRVRVATRLQWLTPSELKIVFSGDKQKMEISDNTGNSLTLTDIKNTATRRSPTSSSLTPIEAAVNKGSKNKLPAHIQGGKFCNAMAVNGVDSLWVDIVEAEESIKAAINFYAREEDEAIRSIHGTGLLPLTVNTGFPTYGQVEASQLRSENHAQETIKKLGRFTGFEGIRVDQTSIAFDDDVYIELQFFISHEDPPLAIPLSKKACGPVSTELPDVSK